MADVEIVVIGAGVVGLAIAQRLSAKHQVFVVDKEENFGRHTSSHNSGVVHAGIYYPTGSLKHVLCLEGNRLLYHWCSRHNVRVNRVGKLIIAVDSSELMQLEDVWNQGRQNGVELSWISPFAKEALWPTISCFEAICSPSTGVVDQMGLMKSLASAAQEEGCWIAFKHTIKALERRGDGLEVLIEDYGGVETLLGAEIVINSAGLWADRLAIGLGYPPEGDTHSPRIVQTVNKGRYYDIITPEKSRRLKQLVYPVPEHRKGGLGVHVTVDIDGGVHLGPDTEWLDEGVELGYQADDLRREDFLLSAKRYLPWLEIDDLAPGQVGYRPKLQRPGEDFADFSIWRDGGYVHLGGIESPGMTAALAIASHVEELLK